MAVRALNLYLLLSTPSDVDSAHIHLIQRTLTQWNVVYGRSLATAVLPMSWSDQAVSEYGQRPQSMINEQLVDDADVVLAVFRDRLGTPTGDALSGTVEEIDRMAELGRPVSILRDRTLRAPLEDAAAATEKARLEDYLSEIRDRALILPYSSDAELVQHVNNTLSHVTTKVDQGAADSRATEAADGMEGADVWPRMEVAESLESDSRGRPRTRRQWSLVLENASDKPAHNVRVRLEALSDGDKPFQVHGLDDPIETMPPRGTFKYPAIVTLGSPDAARCIVDWHDERGEQTNTATVRI